MAHQVDKSVLQTPGENHHSFRACRHTLIYALLSNIMAATLVIIWEEFTIKCRNWICIYIYRRRSLGSYTLVIFTDITSLTLNIYEIIYLIDKFRACSGGPGFSLLRGERPPIRCGTDKIKSIRNPVAVVDACHIGNDWA